MIEAHIDSRIVRRSQYHGDISIRAVHLRAPYSIVSSEAFFGCTSLEYVNFGNTIESINQHAFSRCTKLQHVYINSPYLKRIGLGAFSKCTELKHAYITVSRIEAYTFSYCPALESIRGTPVRILGNKGLAGCTQLQYIDLSALEYIGEDALKYVHKLHVDALPSLKYTDVSTLLPLYPTRRTSHRRTGIRCRGLYVNEDPLAEHDLSMLFEGEAPVYANEAPICTNEAPIAYPNRCIYVDNVRDVLLTDDMEEEGFDDHIAAHYQLSTPEILNPIIHSIFASIDEEIHCKLIDSSDHEHMGDVPDRLYIYNATLEHLTVYGRCIGAEAFYGCPYLESVMLVGVELIHERAFQQCTELKKLRISTPNVLTIRADAFKNCALTDISVDAPDIIGIEPTPPEPPQPTIMTRIPARCRGHSQRMRRR